MTAWLGGWKWLSVDAAALPDSIEDRSTSSPITSGSSTGWLALLAGCDAKIRLFRKCARIVLIHDCNQHVDSRLVIRSRLIQHHAASAGVGAYDLEFCAVAGPLELLFVGGFENCIAKIAIYGDRAVESDGAL